MESDRIVARLGIECRCQVLQSSGMRMAPAVGYREHVGHTPGARNQARPDVCVR